MKCRILCASALAAAILGPLLLPSAATAQIAVSANDNKPALVDGAVKIQPNPAPDTVTIIDLGVTPPKVLAEVQAPSSVAGHSSMNASPVYDSALVIMSPVAIIRSRGRKTTMSPSVWARPKKRI